MDLIELSEASRIYDTNGVSLTALHPTSLNIREREFVCIAGPSGSGKTTLLNLIGGIDDPTAGSVTVAGERLGHLSRTGAARVRLHLIGFVFQSFNLVPVLTAFENVEYPLLLRNLPKAERKRLALEALRSVGLGDLAGKRPKEMSGGQQQRVAVARAIVALPRVVLADEPTANLDSATGKELVTLLRTLNRENGTAFLFSSHDPLIIGCADRVIRLSDGIVVSDETRTPNCCYGDPR